MQWSLPSSHVLPYSQLTFSTPEHPPPLTTTTTTTIPAPTATSHFLPFLSAFFPLAVTLSMPSCTPLTTSISACRPQAYQYMASAARNTCGNQPTPECSFALPPRISGGTSSLDFRPVPNRTTLAGFGTQSPACQRN